MTLNLETIEEIRKPATLEHLNNKVLAQKIDAMVIPAGYELKSLELYREGRERLTGKMETSSLESFGNYVEKYASEGDAVVFIDQENMSATCAVNFGDLENPGHADHCAILKERKTSAYEALLKVTEKRVPQRTAAEWCEDYADFCVFLDSDGSNIEPAKAAKAIRSLKIEANAKASSGVDNYRQEKSLLESVKVDTSEGLPAFIDFTCVPYTDLQERTFRLRLGTGRDNSDMTVFSMQIIRHDLAAQEMAEELAGLVQGKLAKAAVFLGTFTK